MEKNNNKKKYFIELILSNLNKRDFTEDVIINNIKNKIFRQHAIKNYYIFKSKHDRTFNLEYGKGFYYKDGRLYVGDWDMYEATGYILTAEKYVLKCNFGYNLLPESGKGEILIDSKVITVKSTSISGEEFYIKGEIKEIKTGEVFTGEFLAGFDKIHELVQGEGIIYTKGVKYSGYSREYENENDYYNYFYGHDRLKLINNKFQICDNHGNEFTSSVNQHFFPNDYQGSFVYDGNLYEGNFTEDFFEGTATNLKDKSRVFQGKCIGYGLPDIGNGKFLYKNVIFEGEYTNSKANHLTTDLKGRAYSPENPEYYFEGEFKAFLPQSGKGKFIHEGILYDGEVLEKEILNAVVSSTDDQGHEYIFNLNFDKEICLGHGELKFGNFVFKGKWESKTRAYGEVFWKGKKIYEGFFKNFKIDGEGFIGFNGDIHHNNLIYSLNC